MNVNELPQYKCHKVVRAGKILATAHNPNEDAVFLDIDGLDNKWLSVPAGWLSKHNPDIGGYLVAYEDSYLSYSPAEAFEAGYHALPPLGTACGGTGDAAPANTGFLWRKKPVVIEAYKLPAELTLRGAPAWFNEASNNGTIRWCGFDGYALIKTLEGEMRADAGDWIIQGVKGELYPCKPDIFAATYEPAEAIDLDAADFSDALMWLKEGRRVQRAGWNGKGLWLEYRASLGTVDLPYIQLIYPVPGDGSLPYPNGARVPWVPSQTDMLADDWRVV